MVSFQLQSCGANTRIIEGVERRAQGKSEWCWAGCTEMIMDYWQKKIGNTNWETQIGKEPEQCQFAEVYSDTHEKFSAIFSSAFLDTIDCCMNNGQPLFDNVCNQPGWPDNVLLEYKFDYKVRGEQALSWEEIKNEIDCGRPFMYAWAFGIPKKSGHMVVVFGYIEEDGKREMYYWDPWPMGENGGAGGAGDGLEEIEFRTTHYETYSDRMLWRTYYMLQPVEQ